LTGGGTGACAYVFSRGGKRGMDIWMGSART
jgi:hypothetical protein